MGDPQESALPLWGSWYPLVFSGHPRVLDLELATNVFTERIACLLPRGQSQTDNNATGREERYLQTKKQRGPSPTCQGTPGADLGSACLTYMCEGTDSRPHRSLRDPVYSPGWVAQAPGYHPLLPLGASGAQHPALIHCLSYAKKGNVLVSSPAICLKCCFSSAF